MFSGQYEWFLFHLSTDEVYIFTEREHLALLGFIRLYPQGIVFLFQLHCNGNALTLPGHWFHCHQHHCQLLFCPHALCSHFACCLNSFGSVVDYCVWFCLFYSVLLLSLNSSLHLHCTLQFTPVAAVPWTAPSQSSACGWTGVTDLSILMNDITGKKKHIKCLGQSSQTVSKWAETLSL